MINRQSSIVKVNGQPSPPWTLKDLGLVIISIAVFFILANKLIDLTGLETVVNSNQHKSLIMLGGFLLQSLIILIPTWFLVFYKYQNSWEEIGFRSVSIKKTILAVILSYFWYIGFSYLLSSFRFYFDTDIPGFNRQEPHLPLFGEDNLSIYSAFLVIVVIAPVVEEIFFRGFILQTFKKYFGGFLASLLTAGFFALIHFEFQSWLAIFILGLTLNYLCLRFKSLWPSILFHALNNFLALWLEFYLMKHPEVLLS